MKTNEVYLRHILDAIEQIQLYAEDIDKATFEEQGGVIRKSRLAVSSEN